MNPVPFRYICGTTLLAAHCIAIGLIATATNKFDQITEQISSVLIVVPVTIVYVLAFMKYVVANATVTKNVEEPFNGYAASVMLAVVIMFSSAVIFVVVKFIYFSAYGTEEFKMWLGVAETGFGALIGLVFERLFGVKISTQPDAPT